MSALISDIVVPVTRDKGFVSPGMLIGAKPISIIRAIAFVIIGWTCGEGGEGECDDECD